MNTSFLDDIFTISHNGKDVVERKDSNNKILWERAIPKTTSKSASVSLTNTRKTGGDGVTYPVFAPSKVLPSVIAYGKCTQSDGPAPDTPKDIVCNNGTLKAFYGNKYTTVGAQTGVILQQSGHTIQSNSNYSISAPIFLKAGEYKVSYTTDAAGSRPFIICEALPNGNPVPAEDGEVWYKGRPDAGVNTDTFTVDHDMNVLISLRITFTDVFVGPVSAITYADGTPEVIMALDGIEDNDITDKVGLNSSDGGTVNNNSRCYYSKFIQLNEGDTLTVWSLAQNIGGYLFQYSQPIASKSTFYNSLSMSAYEEYNGGYIRQGVATRNCYATFQFTSDWAAAKSNWVSLTASTPQTASAADLFAVEDYEDTQNVMTGAVTRNIGIKVFDGTESYSSMAYGYATDELSSFADEGFVPLCTHFVGKNTASAATDTIRLYFTSGGVPRTYFFVDQTVDDFSTADKFKAWIAAQYAAGTPVIVVYPLATPQTEQATSTSGQISLDHKGTYTLSTSGSVSNLQIQATYLGR